MCKCQPARFRQVLIANAPRRSQGVYRCRLIEFSSCASHRRSSNANSLCGRKFGWIPEICATFQRDILTRHF